MREFFKVAAAVIFALLAVYSAANGYQFFFGIVVVAMFWALVSK